MPDSALTFAREFERLKSDLDRYPAPDTRFMRLVEHAPSVVAVAKKPAYRSWVDEFTALVRHVVAPESLADLTIAELTGALDALEQLRLPDQARLLREELLRKYAWVGDIPSAVTVAAAIEGGASSPGAEIPGDDALSEQDRLADAIEQLKPSSPAVAARLESVLADWQDHNGDLWFDRVRCLFVEKNGGGERGRMRTLIGSVERRDGKASLTNGEPADELVFQNQLRSEDDPFVGAASSALMAVRRQLTRGAAGRSRTERRTPYHARYSIEDTPHTLTGDSIGLAAGLIAYTQLLKPDLQRTERFVSSEVAFTGGLDREGRLTPVAEDTLALKIERAFFSPVKYLVLPAANMEAAVRCLAEAGERYPHRRLRLIAADRLTDVIENHNIVRSERICIGPYLARKAYRYGRMAKLQVPLLAILIWVLLAVVWPRTFDPWFDRKPDDAFVMADKISIRNKDSHKLRDIPIPPGYEVIPYCWSFQDFDSDAEPELVFTPSPLHDSLNPYLLMAFEPTGELLREIDCSKSPPFSTGLATKQGKHRKAIALTRFSDAPAFIVVFHADYPARTVMQIWNPDGQLKGWMICRGHCGYWERFQIGAQNLIITGTDNDLSAPVLYVVGDDSTGLTWSRKIKNVRVPLRGEGLVVNAGIAFPPTPLCEPEEIPYGALAAIRTIDSETIRVDVIESEQDQRVFTSYFLGPNLIVDSAKVSDFYAVRWHEYQQAGRLASSLSNQSRSSIERVLHLKDSAWVPQSELLSKNLD